jgi:hypothetical protein
MADPHENCQAKGAKHKDWPAIPGIKHALFAVSVFEATGQVVEEHQPGIAIKS